MHGLAVYVLPGHGRVGKITKTNEKIQAATPYLQGKRCRLYFGDSVAPTLITYIRKENPVRFQKEYHFYEA